MFLNDKWLLMGINQSLESIATCQTVNKTCVCVKRSATATVTLFLACTTILWALSLPAHIHNWPHTWTTMLAARGLLQCMASASTIMRRTAVQCVKRNASTVSTAADSAIPMEPSLPFMFTNRSMLSKQIRMDRERMWYWYVFIVLQCLRCMLRTRSLNTCQTCAHFQHLPLPLHKKVSKWPVYCERDVWRWTSISTRSCGRGQELWERD